MLNVIIVTFLLFSQNKNSNVLAGPTKQIYLQNYIANYETEIADLHSTQPKRILLVHLLCEAFLRNERFQKLSHTNRKMLLDALQDVGIFGTKAKSKTLALRKALDRLLISKKILIVSELNTNEKVFSIKGKKDFSALFESQTKKDLGLRSNSEYLQFGWLIDLIVYECGERNCRNMVNLHEGRESKVPPLTTQSKDKLSELVVLFEMRIKFALLFTVVRRHKKLFEEEAVFLTIQERVEICNDPRIRPVYLQSIVEAFLCSNHSILCDTSSSQTKVWIKISVELLDRRLTSESSPFSSLELMQAFVALRSTFGIPFGVVQFCDYFYSTSENTFNIDKDWHHFFRQDDSIPQSKREAVPMLVNLLLTEAMPMITKQDKSSAKVQSSHTERDNKIYILFDEIILKALAGSSEVVSSSDHHRKSHYETDQQIRLLAWIARWKIALLSSPVGVIILAAILFAIDKWTRFSLFSHSFAQTKSPEIQNSTNFTIFSSSEATIKTFWIGAIGASLVLSLLVVALVCCLRASAKLPSAKFDKRSWQRSAVFSRQKRRRKRFHKKIIAKRLRKLRKMKRHRPRWLKKLQGAEAKKHKQSTAIRKHSALWSIDQPVSCPV